MRGSKKNMSDYFGVCSPPVAACGCPPQALLKLFIITRYYQYL